MTRKHLYLALIPILVIVGCDRPNPMLGRWLYRHEMFRCYTVVEVKPDGHMIETLKLSTLDPSVTDYKMRFTGQGTMELVSKRYLRNVKYSVIGDTMRIKEPGSANDAIYVRMKPNEIVPWEDMSKPQNRPGATSTDRTRLEGRLGGQEAGKRQAEGQGRQGGGRGRQGGQGGRRGGAQRADGQPQGGGGEKAGS